MFGHSFMNKYSFKDHIISVFLYYVRKVLLFAYSLPLIIQFDKGTLFPHKHTELYIISLMNKHKTKDLTKMLTNPIQIY